MSWINKRIAWQMQFIKNWFRSYVGMSWITKEFAAEAIRKSQNNFRRPKEHNQDLENLYFNLPADTDLLRIEMLSK
jgi:hypothetical protein